MVPLDKPTRYRLVYASERARAIAEATWFSALPFVVLSPRVTVGGLFDICRMSILKEALEMRDALDLLALIPVTTSSNTNDVQNETKT